MIDKGKTKDTEKWYEGTFSKAHREKGGNDHRQSQPI